MKGIISGDVIIIAQSKSSGTVPSHDSEAKPA
jgi:hypothetical protein